MPFAPDFNREAEGGFRSSCTVGGSGCLEDEGESSASGGALENRLVAMNIGRNEPWFHGFTKFGE